MFWLRKICKRSKGRKAIFRSAFRGLLCFCDLTSWAPKLSGGEQAGRGTKKERRGTRFNCRLKSLRLGMNRRPQTAREVLSPTDGGQMFTLSLPHLNGSMGRRELSRGRFSGRTQESASVASRRTYANAGWKGGKLVENLRCPFASRD